MTMWKTFSASKIKYKNKKNLNLTQLLAQDLSKYIA